MKIFYLIGLAIMLTSTTSCVKKYTCTLTNLSTGEVISETKVNSQAECDTLKSIEEARLNNPFT
ncbi:MAG: hypothetical protein JKY84_11525 [Emcibacteraceae bacterium]|nr:hypothetical protein [Emcibacteraceae bacterium]